MFQDLSALQAAFAAFELSLFVFSTFHQRLNKETARRNSIAVHWLCTLPASHSLFIWLLSHSFIHSVTPSLIYFILHSFIHLLIHSVTHSFVCSIAPLLTQSVSHSLSQSVSQLRCIKRQVRLLNLQNVRPSAFIRKSAVCLFRPNRMLLMKQGTNARGTATVFAGYLPIQY